MKVHVRRDSLLSAEMGFRSYLGGTTAGLNPARSCGNGDCLRLYSFHSGSGEGVLALLVGIESHPFLDERRNIALLRSRKRFVRSYKMYGDGDAFGAFHCAAAIVMRAGLQPARLPDVDRRTSCSVIVRSSWLRCGVVMLPAIDA